MIIMTISKTPILGRREFLREFITTGRGKTTEETNDRTWGWAEVDPWSWTRPTLDRWLLDAAGGVAELLQIFEVVPRDTAQALVIQTWKTALMDTTNRYQRMVDMNHDEPRIS